MQAFSWKHITGAFLGGVPLFLFFLGIILMEDLVSSSGGRTLPGIGLWGFTMSMGLVFIGYSMLFFSRRVLAPSMVKLFYPGFAAVGAFVLISVLGWAIRSL
jgi:hypothetical protein